MLPRHNAASGVEAAAGAFVLLLDVDPDEILCLKAARTLRNDNCVAHHGRLLRIPPQRHRIHYVRAEVEVREYEDGRLAVSHGPLRLGRYDADGRARGGERPGSGGGLKRTPAPRSGGGDENSGHITCYQTGHVHLLLTVP